MVPMRARPGEKTPMKEFSLVVVTTNRIHFVDRLFKSLAGQEYKNFTVIFTHDDDMDEYAALLEKKYSCLFAIKRMPLKKCGVSCARNRALALARGDYIAFPDDDCEYFPDTLANAEKVFESQPDIDGILASKITDGKAGNKRKASKPVNLYNIFSGSETFLQFYRQHCVNNIGGFDESLGWGTGLPYGSGEDTDYAIRAIRQGCKIIRAADVRVRHPNENLDKPETLIKTAKYAAGRMQLLRKFNYPAWFKIANVFLPLMFLPRDIIRQSGKITKWRWKMFAERLQNYSAPKEPS